MSASAAFQSVPGPQISATYNATNAQIAPSLHRDLAAGPSSTLALQIVAPGTLYNDRLNQLDARFTKNFRLQAGAVSRRSSTSTTCSMSGRLNHNNTYGAARLTPTVIPVGRMVRRWAVRL
jgi:hypothetical protein